MKELIQTIAEALVDHPEGRIAKAIRNVLKAYAVKNNVHVVLDILSD